MPVQNPLRPADVTASAAGGGLIRAHDLNHARCSVAHAAGHAAEPVLAAQVRLVHHRDPALDRPYSARASLDLNGRIVRAHVNATTIGHAIDALDARLHAQIERLHRYRDHRAAGVLDRTESPARPGGRRGPHRDRSDRVVQRRSYVPATATIDEAAWDLDLMDYQFLLFVDADSGRDSVIYRAGPTGYRLAQVDPSAGWRPRAEVALSVSTVPVPRLTLPAALDLLTATGRPFQFYAVAAGRGRIAYRRDDGDIGVLVPPA